MQVYQSEVYMTSFCYPFSQGIEITSTGCSNHYVTGTAVEVRLSYLLTFSPLTHKSHRVWFRGRMIRFLFLALFTQSVICAVSGLLTNPRDRGVNQTSAPLELKG